MVETEWGIIERNKRHLVLFVQVEPGDPESSTAATGTCLSSLPSSDLAIALKVENTNKTVPNRKTFLGDFLARQR